MISILELNISFHLARKLRNLLVDIGTRLSSFTQTFLHSWILDSKQSNWVMIFASLIQSHLYFQIELFLRIVLSRLARNRVASSMNR